MKYFFKTLGAHILDSFSGPKKYFHLALIATTILIVKTGFDWRYFLATRDPELNEAFFPAVIVGGLIPILVPPILIWLGVITKKKKVRMLGWALGQAALIGWIISSTYKAFTGRIEPNLFDLVNDSSHGFQFGFLKHGIFWGWPSSHTTVAFAMAFALMGLFQKNKAVIFFSLMYALYIGIGVSFSIHWFSEFVAGAILGTCIGITVERGFSKQINGL
jgi:membrane-associated phospholipid phosphatase